MSVNVEPVNVVVTPRLYFMRVQDKDNDCATASRKLNCFVC